MKHFCIILLDDDIEDMDILEESLTGSGRFTVVAACTQLNDLLRQLSIMQRLPDAVICDLTMPAKNGIDVCNAVKSTPAYKAIPFILLSGMPASARVLEEAESCGVTGVFVKPVSLEDFQKFGDVLYTLLKDSSVIHKRP